MCGDGVHDEEGSQRTLKLNVAVDDALAVKIRHGGHELAEYALNQLRAQKVAHARGKVKEVTARAVAHDEDGARLLDAPGAQVDDGRVPDDLHNLELALQAHLDAIFAGTAAGAVLADLDGDERLAVQGAVAVLDDDARRHLGLGGVGHDLARGEHDSTKRAAAQQAQAPPSPRLVVVSALRREELDRLGRHRGAAVFGGIAGRRRRGLCNRGSEAAGFGQVGFAPDGWLLGHIGGSVRARYRDRPLMYRECIWRVVTDASVSAVMASRCGRRP